MFTCLHVLDRKLTIFNMKIILNSFLTLFLMSLVLTNAFI